MAELLEQLSGALAARYQILRELGQGGMAKVFLARDLKYEREVAVKGYAGDVPGLSVHPQSIHPPVRAVVLEDVGARAHGAEEHHLGVERHRDSERVNALELKPRDLLGHELSETHPRRK